MEHILGQCTVSYVIRAWVISVLLCVACAALASPEIIGLPDDLDAEYDLTWSMRWQGDPAASAGVSITAPGGHGYRLAITPSAVRWSTMPGTTPAVHEPLALTPGDPLTCTLKRRQELVAVLVNGQLTLTAAIAALADEQVDFDLSEEAGWELDEVRYLPVGPIAFGDDFMRPEGAERFLTALVEWVEDSIWRTAAPPPPADSAGVTNPWQLALLPVSETSTNGFWFTYGGQGPSQVVAHPLHVFPHWDQYYLEASIKPDFDSEVGLIVAYQHPEQYLLLKVTPRLQAPATIALIAVTDGQSTPLAAAPCHLLPNQWYRLRVNLGWQRVQAFLDEQLLLDAKNPGLIEGRVGLYADHTPARRTLAYDRTTGAAYLSNPDAVDTLLVQDVLTPERDPLTYFDDIRVGDWRMHPDLIALPHPVQHTGQWQQEGDTLVAAAPGRIVARHTPWTRYRLTTRLALPAGGSAGLFFHLDAQQNGYAWLVSERAHSLRQVAQGVIGDEIARAALALPAGTWGDVQVDADGPYVTVRYQDTVLEAYDPTRTAGQCGLLAYTRAVRFAPLALEQIDPVLSVATMRPFFAQDHWLVTWASPEADWYPAQPPAVAVTPLGDTLDTVGQAAPLVTNTPGLYWQKGGHYRRVRLAIPLAPDRLQGQRVHLTAHDDTAQGYRIDLTGEGAQGMAHLWRNDALVATYPFAIADCARLLIERCGAYLILTAQELDPDDEEVLSSAPPLVYRDPHPLTCTQVGFVVVHDQLPAAAITVESDQYVDTFEEAPVRWATGSGIWGVMSRYSCQPQWNWFGGSGVQPTAWTKQRLDGDQIVEAYLGVITEAPLVTEAYAQRFRDMNLSICADGARPNSGYSVCRATLRDGQPVTLLLRQGAVVQESRLPAHQLPPDAGGHRQWFATRIEKQGDEIRVYLDNRLAMTYRDPEPLSGGFVAVWSTENGIMMGRVNYAAERLSWGQPAAEAPLDCVSDPLTPQVLPAVSLNGQPIAMATFENSFDGLQTRRYAGYSLFRRRSRDAEGVPNTHLEVMMHSPTREHAVLLYASAQDLARTPTLHCDYQLLPAARINLYVQVGHTWYEFLLTGDPVTLPGVRAAGSIPVQADGAWHHLAFDLGPALWDAIAATGQSPTSLRAEAILLADWRADKPEFAGAVEGHSVPLFCLDNLALLPAITGPLQLTWGTAARPGARWRVGIDAHAAGQPQEPATTTTLTLTPTSTLQFVHLTLDDPQEPAMPVLHLPLLLARGIALPATPATPASPLTPPRAARDEGVHALLANE